MAEKGWIHKYAFENNALSADAEGRKAMQDGYLTTEKIAATVRAADLILGRDDFAIRFVELSQVPVN